MTNPPLASTDEICEMVLEIVGDHLGRPSPTLSLGNDIAADLGADSFDKMELIMTIEELFSIQICRDVTKAIQTIGDVVDAIARAGLSARHISRVKGAWKHASRGE